MTRRSVICGTGHYLPERIVENSWFEDKLDTTDEWIRSRTGIERRHFAAEGQTTSDLAIRAAKAALDRAGMTADDIDGVVLATSTPDFTFPAVATMVQAGLGMKRGFAYDVQAVCAGFVFALANADAMIRAGQADRILVIGAETFSRILDWEDRATCVLFGDGAGAVVLEASETPGILSSAAHADGSYNGILSVPGSVCGGKITGDPFLRMDGQAVFKLAVRVLAEVAKECCEIAGVPPAEIDWLIPHQANIRIIESTAKKMGLGMDKVVVTVDRHGNTSAASIPLALDLAVRDGRIARGQKVLLEGVGGGFTWGAVLLEF